MKVRDSRGFFSKKRALDSSQFSDMFYITKGKKRGMWAEFDTPTRKNEVSLNG